MNDPGVRLLPGWAGVLTSFCLWALLMFSPPALSVQPQATTLVVGVLAHRSVEDVAERWRPLERYLEMQLDGVAVQVLALTYAEINDRIDRQGLDLVLTNPSHFVELRQRNPLSGVLLTLVPLAGQTPLSSFGGVIITRADNPDIHEVAQLAGRRVAAVNPSSLGGYQAQLAMLNEMRVSLPVVEFLHGTHDSLVEAVIDGRHAAGFIRSGVVEAMVEEGRLAPDALRVLNPQQLPGYPHAVSTRLYPEWPLFAAPHVDPALVRRVAAVLLMLEPHSSISRRIGIHGFTVPADYQVVENLLRSLRLPPFDVSVEVRWSDVWAQYAAWLIALSVFGVLLVAGTVHIFVLGRQARNANRRFDKLFKTVPAPIVLLKDGVLVDCNRAAFKMLAYPSKDAIVGKTLPDLSPSVQADGTRTVLAVGQIASGMREGDSQSFDWTFQRGDGELCQAAVTLLPISASNGRLLLGVWHDITERHHEHQLLASELALFSEGPVIVIEWRGASEWSVVSVSSNVTNELGYTPEEMTDSSFSFANLLHPDDLDRIRNESQVCCASGRSSWEQSYRLRRKSGVYAWYSDHTQAVRDENGVVLALRGYLIDQSATKRLELQLEQERRSLYNILWGTGVGTWEWNVETGEVRLNERWAGMIGYRLDELAPLSIDLWLDLIHPDDRAVSEEALKRHFAGLTEHYECELRMRHRNGDIVWVLSRGKVTEWSGLGTPLWVSGTLLDITARKRQEEQHRSLVEALSDADIMLMVVDEQDTVRYMNRSMLEQFGDRLGSSSKLLLGETLREFDRSDGTHPTTPHSRGRYRCSLESKRVFDVTVVPYTDMTGADCRLEVIRDVSVEHRQKLALEHIAYHDALTGLANRPLFRDRLQQAVVDARRRKQLIAVVYIDLDGFKDVNDCFGHACGDALLVSIAQGMKNSLRESDTVARLGGDEFAVVLRDLISEEVAMFLVRRLLQTASMPVFVGEQRVQVSASIGVCFLLPGSDADADQLLRRADKAMYKAKNLGKNQIRVFDGRLSSPSLS